MTKTLCRRLIASETSRPVVVLLATAIIYLAVLLGIGISAFAGPPVGKGGGKGGGGDTKCQEGLFSPVILAREFFVPGRPVQMNQDGSCLEVISILGDLMHKRMKGERYFLTSEPVTLPDGSQRSIVVAYEESGDPNTRQVLTSDPSIDRFGQPRWSIDGTRVAYVGARYDPDFGGVIEEGIFVGEVIFDGAVAPDQIVNERLVVEADPNEYLIPVLSWSGDRITYETSRPVYDTDGTIIDYERSIYVADLSIDPPVSYEIQFADGSIEYYPSFSPVDNLLAFTRNTSRAGCVRNDIYAVNVPFDYDGFPLVATQITNKNNAKNLCQLRRAYWSPDGTYLAFDAWDLSLKGGMQIYTIKSNGSGKAVKLTNSKNQGYLVTGWRE